MPPRSPGPEADHLRGGSRRVRSAVLATIAGSAAAMLLAWSQPWFQLRLSTGGGLPVGGDRAAPALAALALAGLVLTAALAISGRRLRTALGAIQMFIAGSAAATVLTTLVDPVAASSAAVTAATAVAGDDATSTLVTALDPTGWPWLALAAAAAALAGGVSAVATAGRWPVSGRRYRAGETDGERDAVGDWDALSDGEDPTAR